MKSTTHSVSTAIVDQTDILAQRLKGNNSDDKLMLYGLGSTIFICVLHSMVISWLRCIEMSSLIMPCLLFNPSRQVGRVPTTVHSLVVK